MKVRALVPLIFSKQLHAAFFFLLHTHAFCLFSPRNSLGSDSNAVHHFIIVQGLYTVSSSSEKKYGKEKRGNLV